MVTHASEPQRTTRASGTNRTQKNSLLHKDFWQPIYAQSPESGAASGIHPRFGASEPGWK